MKTVFAVMACLLLVSFAMAQVTVGGRVLANQDGELVALPGATVTLMSMGTMGGGMGGGRMTTLTATTDDNGVYSFANVAAGTYSLRATLTGYTLTRCITFTVATGATAPVVRDITMIARTTRPVTRCARMD